MPRRISAWTGRASAPATVQAPHRTAKLHGLGAGLAAFVTTLGLGIAGAPAVAAEEQPGAAFVDVIVRLSPDADVRAAVRETRGQGGHVSATYRRSIDGFAARVDLRTLEALRSDPDVVAVERDRPVQVLDAPTWGLDRIDQRALPLSGGFSPAGTGSGVTTYVVDTGIASGHEQFGGRVRSGFTTISDGLGTEDCHGHGTHVAGTVAGATLGVAPAATAVPVRVLACDGSGWMSDVISGLEWIALDHPAGAPAVANLSLGGSASSSVDAAVNALVADGVSVVVSAGNSATDACTASPARTPAALTVGATDAKDRVATFSNQGSCLDLFAPGVSVLSAWPSSSTATAHMSGTSMAAPHVAGAAAALLGGQPALTPAEVAAVLTADATTESLTGLQAGSPNRLLHLASAPQVPAPTGSVAPAPATAPAPSPAPAQAPVPPAPTLPGAPSSPSATTSGTTATLAWAPAADGGSPVTSQTISVRRAGDLVRTDVVAAEVTSWEVLGLRPGVTYTLTVSATNVVGTGPESAAAEVAVAATTPAAPRAVTVRATKRTATVRWRTGENGGAALRGHVVKAYVAGRAKPVATVTTKAGSTKAVLRKLPPDTKLRFVVRAINEVGTGKATRSPHLRLR